MTFLNKRKYDLIGIGLVFLFFIISLQIRKENLKAPLSRHHEWITAHALITAQIWDDNGGPSAYGFNPVYTKKGAGNAYRPMLGGVTAENGDVYYVSYPPFAFIYLYYSSQLFGGPSLFSVRFAALSLHLISALLLYFLIGALRPETKKNTLNFAGILGAGLYTFAQGHLWFHGNLFFSDMVVQPLFIGGLLLTIRYLRKQYNNEKIILLLLFLTFFLATYTEWLGLLSAFFSGLCFLIFALIKKRKRFLRPFAVIALGSSLALGLTIYQYSSIDGWEALKATSEKKYTERSGYSMEQDSAARFNIHKAESLDFLQKKFNGNYKSLENFVGFTLGILVLALLVSRIKRFTQKPPSYAFKEPLILIILAFLPILAHYLLFYNFNVMHEFSGLKTATFFIIITAIAVDLIYRIASNTHKYYAWSVLLFFSTFFILKSIQSTQRYLVSPPMQAIDFERIKSAETIAKHSTPDIAVFCNVRLSPEQTFYANHSISSIKDNDTSAMLHIMTLRRNTKAQYYHHDGSVLKSMVTIEREADNLVFLDTIVFN